MFNYTYEKMSLAINIINYLRDTKEPKVDNVKKTIFESSLDEEGKKDILMFLKDCLTTSDVPDYIESLILYCDIMIE